MSNVDSWKCSTFSITNPQNEDGSDLPALLRRLAAQMESSGISGDDVRDLVFSREDRDGVESWVATLYYD